MAAVAETSGLRSLESANSAVNSAIDEDDDDLETLRSVALMSMKAKRKAESQAPAETATVSQSYSRFQHAKRSTGTGKFPWNQHARPNLIVIQPVPLEGEQVQCAKTNSYGSTDPQKCADEVKLLLPQHRWCPPPSDESSSPQTATARRRVSGKFSHFESSSSDSEDSGDDDFLRSASPSSHTSNDCELKEAEANDATGAEPSQDDSHAEPIVNSCNNTDSRLTPSPVPNVVPPEDQEKTCNLRADNTETDPASVVCAETPADSPKRCKSDSQKDAKTDRSHPERRDKPPSSTRADLSPKQDAIDRLEARRRKFESNVPIQPVSRKIVLLKGSKGENCDTYKGDTGSRDKGWERDKCSPEKSPPPVLRSVLSVVRVTGDDTHRDVVLVDEGRRKRRSQGRTVEIIEDGQEPLYIGDGDRKKVPVHLRLGQVSPPCVLRKRKGLSKETSSSKRAKSSSTSLEPLLRRKDRQRHSRRKREPAGSS
ncbi:uncharacterized protein LOC135368728 [Ornithodoros turicata]|uniref:uncharacterized protein LOC135368728 n=1 Tax=Ornithodoros turicata TaxID=34597 RepID=UPI0031395D06